MYDKESKELVNFYAEEVLKLTEDDHWTSFHKRSWAARLAEAHGTIAIYGLERAKQLAKEHKSLRHEDYD